MFPKNITVTSQILIRIATGTGFALRMMSIETVRYSFSILTFKQILFDP